MKNVKQFEKFDQEEKILEHHMNTKEDQIKYICDNVNNLSDNDVEYIYNHIEAKMS